MTLEQQTIRKILDAATAGDQDAAEQALKDYAEAYENWDDPIRNMKEVGLDEAEKLLSGDPGLMAELKKSEIF